MINLFTYLFACQNYADFVEDGEWLPGGETTNTFMLGSNAFIMPAENILIENEPGFYTGNSFFNQAWVESPASTEKRDGLGPMYNALSCAACHFKDGRGAPPLEEGEKFLGLLLRASIQGEDDVGGPLPSPIYGSQIHPFSIQDVPAEANPTLRYEEIEGRYADGTPYQLLNPIYDLENNEYGEESEELMLSPRVAPHVIGMGLLNAIPAQRLLALADPDDDNKDGISGRVNWVWDFEANDYEIGRFGWKAEQTSVRNQVAGAFAEDIGITNPIISSSNCSDVQILCQESTNGGNPEIEEDLFDKVVLYTSLLAVPMRTNWQELDVLAGKVIFQNLNCDGCHVASHQTESDDFFDEVSDQLIWPYTDLLLHDMGEGLADNRPTFEATGQEWKTPPLWSIGLIDSVNHHTRFLHDGRARNLSEAILWHGGEAEKAKEGFRHLSAAERKLLIQFLESL